jgi:hypothetical protein
MEESSDPFPPQSPQLNVSRLKAVSKAERKVPKINLDEATNEKYKLEPGSRHRALTGMNYMLSEQVKSPDFKWAHNLGAVKAKFMKTIMGAPASHGAKTQPVGFYFHNQHFKLTEHGAKPEKLGVVAGQPLKTKKVLMPVTSIDEPVRQLGSSDLSTARHLESHDSIKQGGRRREVMKVYQPQPFTSKRSSIQDIVSNEQPSTHSLKHDLSFARQIEDKPLSASSNTARAPNTPLTKGGQPLMDVTYMPIPLNQIKIVTSPGHSSPQSSGRTGSPYQGLKSPKMVPAKPVEPKIEKISVLSTVTVAIDKS